MSKISRFIVAFLITGGLVSYLNAPRLHFFGRFQADPSTLNNDPCNYDPATTSPDPSWNPDGSHTFRITGCTVTGLTMADGSSGHDDPLLGAPLQSIDKPSPAKLVDLDTEQQMVSMIFGMRLEAGGDASGSFTGVFEPVCFNDIFFRVVGGQADSVFSAYYQSVLTNVKWSNTKGSPFLKALSEASPNQLSIKFVVDGFNDQATTVDGAPNPDFTFGRVVGTIGPAQDNEPSNFVVGRLLRPTTPSSGPSASPQFNYGWAVVDATRNLVTFDLGNSLPTKSVGGPPPSNLGSLTAVVLPPGSPFSTNVPDALAATLGEIDYSEAAYQSTGYIQVFSASPDVIAQIQSGAEIALAQNLGGNSATVVLQENETCAYLNATPYVFRMNPGETAPVEVMAVQNGAASANQVIALGPNNAVLSGQVATNCPDGNLSIGVPVSALIYPPSVKTGADGKATFTLTASDPGRPRSYLNGQLYGVGFAAANLDSNPNPYWFLSVNVYSSTPVPPAPTWLQDVLPILKPYAKLYPFMDQIIQLDDYAAVKAAMKSIAAVLTLPIEAPNHMPVTRDMSANQRKTILKWIANGAPQGQAT
jgi:hypothetical protein